MAHIHVHICIRRLQPVGFNSCASPTPPLLEAISLFPGTRNSRVKEASKITCASLLFPERVLYISHDRNQDSQSFVRMRMSGRVASVDRPTCGNIVREGYIGITTDNPDSPSPGIHFSHVRCLRPFLSGDSGRRALVDRAHPSVFHPIQNRKGPALRRERGIRGALTGSGAPDLTAVDVYLCMPCGVYRR